MTADSHARYPNRHVVNSHRFALLTRRRNHFCRRDDKQPCLLSSFYFVSLQPLPRPDRRTENLSSVSLGFGGRINLRQR
jgi:hypothetical protein